tara:strand:+ start:2062 stop:2457 length:396 start_codon:yes stop_codon:yes gene_type:complete
MATLNHTLTLSSSDISSDTLSITLVDALSVTSPTRNLSTIIADNTGANSIIIPAGTAITYLFVRHSGTTDGSTATTQLVDLENTDNEAFARLGPGEFLFMPFNHGGASVGVQLQVAHASNVQMEYGYWTKS